MNDIKLDNLDKGFPADGQELQFMQHIKEHFLQIARSLYGFEDVVLSPFGVQKIGGATKYLGGYIMHDGDIWYVPATALIPGNHEWNEFKIDFSETAVMGVYQTGETLPVYTVRTASMYIPSDSVEANASNFKEASLLDIRKKWNIATTSTITTSTGSIAVTTDLVVIYNRGTVNVRGLVKLVSDANNQQANVIDLPVADLTDGGSHNEILLIDDPGIESGMLLTPNDGAKAVSQAIINDNAINNFAYYQVSVKENGTLYVRIPGGENLVSKSIRVPINITYNNL
ncbi:MAG: hypothetical protein LBR17_08410 [Bacteroidales bacterium]|jgi:hypothetical protein|nr:hypothetical protein [Bacteroidales bacterium]